MWLEYNENPQIHRVGDCTIRAISTATGQDWKQTYIGICIKGYDMCDMPSANAVWGAYLIDKGFRKYPLNNICTVKEFCTANPYGVYVLALQAHVICVINGNYIDTWDSGDEYIVNVWSRE